MSLFSWAYESLLTVTRRAISSNLPLTHPISPLFIFLLYVFLASKQRKRTKRRGWVHTLVAKAAPNVKAFIHLMALLHSLSFALGPLSMEGQLGAWGLYIFDLCFLTLTFSFEKDVTDFSSWSSHNILKNGIIVFNSWANVFMIPVFSTPVYFYFNVIERGIGLVAYVMHEYKDCNIYVPSQVMILTVTSLKHLLYIQQPELIASIGWKSKRADIGFLGNLEFLRIWALQDMKKIPYVAETLQNRSLLFLVLQVNVINQLVILWKTYKVIVLLKLRSFIKQVKALQTRSSS